MARKRFTSEQIITMLREAEVLVNQGFTVIEVARCGVGNLESYPRVPAV